MGLPCIIRVLSGAFGRCIEHLLGLTHAFDDYAATSIALLLFWMRFMHQTTEQPETAFPGSDRDHVTKVPHPFSNKRSLEFQLVSELAGVLTWEYDTAAQTIAWSPGAEHILGFPPPSTSSGFVDAVHPDDRESVVAGIMKWVHDGERFDIEHRMVAPETSRTIWLRSRAAIPEIEDDHHRLIGVSQDITEYRLREGNARFLADIQDSLATARDPESSLREVSQHICDHLDLTALSIVQVSAPDDRMTLLHEHLVGLEPDIPPGSVTPLSRFIPGDMQQTLANGHHVAINDTASDARVKDTAGAFAGIDIRSVLYVPYIAEGQWSMLLCANRQQPHDWQEQEIELLGEIAERLCLRFTHARIEQHLRLSEERYHILFESISEGFGISRIIFDDTGKACDALYIDTNPAFERHTGLTNVVGKCLRDLVPDIEEDWFAALGEVAKTGQATTFSGYSAALGNRWFEVNAFRLGEPEDHTVAATLTDITDRKRTEETLRESESRLQRVFAIDSVGIIYFQPEGRVTYANDAFLRMSGYTPEDVAKGIVRLETMTAPEWRPDAKRAMDEFLSRGRIAPYEKEYLRKDGTRWWGLFAASRISEQEGVKFIINIDQSKLAEAERDRLADIVEDSNDAIIRCDPDGTIADANHAATELYGYSMEEMIGRNIMDTSPPDRRHEYAESYARLLCGEPVPPWESIRQRRDGSEIQVEIRMSPIRDPHGVIIGCSGIVRDVTERKRLEQAQEDFLAMASHDLRSPVTVLLGRAQLMRRRKTYDEAGIHSIIDQARRIERLSADLQQVVHLESGKLELRPSEFDLSTIAADAIERIRLTAPTSDVHLEVPSAPVEGWWDRMRLTQILDNLLLNAVKYSPDDGHISVQVSAENGIARIQVTDHGVGISPVLQRRLFQRFYRADETGVASGLGLGLYISRMLAEAHGGTIQVKSKPGRGSVFTVLLPQYAASDE